MTSKLGIHGIMSEGTLNTLQTLVEAGATMATIKAVEGAGWLREVKALDPNVKTVGRFVRGADDSVNVEGPDLTGDLRKMAEAVMASSMARWDEHRAYVDYWEVINEQDPPGTDGHRRLAEFMIHCMDIAEANGYRLGLFSYSLGVPEWDEMQAVVETGVFGRAKAGGHMFALHEYAYPMNVWFGEPIPGRPAYPDRGPLACRYRWWYEDFLKPRNEVIPLYLTEVNLARDLPLVTVEEWMEQMVWYDARLREDTYVVGAHLFTLGSGGGWANYEFTEMLPSLIEHIIALKGEVTSVGEEPEIVSSGPVMTPEPRERPVTNLPVNQPRGAFERHYLLLPPDVDDAWLAACYRYWDKYRMTVGSNIDDAGYAPGAERRAVTVVNPNRWNLNLKAFFDEHYPGITYDPIRVDTAQELEQYLNWRVENDRRFG